MLVVSLAEVVNRDHVRMTQHCRRTGFSTKARHCGIVCDVLARQYLYRHIVANVYTPRAIDDAHAAFTQASHEFIFAVDLVSDQWIGIHESNGRKGRDEVVLVIRMCAWAGQS